MSVISVTVVRDVCGANRTLEPHIQLSRSSQPSIFIWELSLAYNLRLHLYLFEANGNSGRVSRHYGH
jgi:hypothetical protein